MSEKNLPFSAKRAAAPKPFGYAAQLLHPGFQVALLFGLGVFGFWATSPLLSYAIAAESEGSIVALVLRTFVLLLALSVFLNARKLRNGLPLVLPLILFTVIYAYRMYDNFFIENYNIYIDWVVAFSMLFGAGLIPSIILFYSAAYLSRQEDDLRVVMFALMIMFLVGIFLNAELLYQRTELQASLEKVNSIAMTSIATSFALFAVLQLRNGGVILSALSIACLVGLAAIAAIAKARGPLVGTAVSLLAYFLLIPGRQRAQLIKVLAVGAAGLIALQFFSGFNLFEEMLSKFDYVEDGGAGDSVSMRKLAWQAAWEQFLADPFMGKLMYETALGHYPHNIVLEVLMATGLVGAFFFGAYLFVSLRAAVFLMRRPDITMSQSFVVLMFFKELTQNMFSGAVWGASGLMITSCCLIGMAEAARRQPLAGMRSHGTTRT
ncbi:MAG: O-antigen ligase family protein [Hyphomicrobiaceae bacterium]